MKMAFIAILLGTAVIFAFFFKLSEIETIISKVNFLRYIGGFYKLPRRGKLSITSHANVRYIKQIKNRRVGDTRSQTNK